MSALRVGLLGYGLAGRVFHAPLIAATPGLEVTTIVTADPDRRARAGQDVPRARVVASADEVWARADEHDLVVVATTTGTHVALASAAVDAGLAVVVEKPLAPRAGQARALVERAAAAQVMLTVFHNRRWDAEYLTLRRLVADGALGDVVRYESRFERWRPERTPGAWREELSADDGGGVLLDLGVHLVDQARSLLGPVTHVYGEVAARRGGCRRRRVHGAAARLRGALAPVGERRGRRARAAPARARQRRGVRGRAPRRAGGRPAGRAPTRRGGVR